MNGGPVFWPEQIVSDRILVDYIDAFELLKYLNGNKMEGVRVKDDSEADRLKGLGRELTETSNPVLLILK